MESKRVFFSLLIQFQGVYTVITLPNVFFGEIAFGLFFGNNNLGENVFCQALKFPKQCFIAILSFQLRRDEYQMVVLKILGKFLSWTGGE